MQCSQLQRDQHPGEGDSTGSSSARARARTWLDSSALARRSPPKLLYPTDRRLLSTTSTRRTCTHAMPGPRPSTSRRRLGLLAASILALPSAIASPFHQKRAPVMEPGGYYNPTSNGGKWLTVRRHPSPRPPPSLGLPPRLRPRLHRLTLLLLRNSSHATPTARASPSTLSSSSTAAPTTTCSTTGPSRSTLARTSSTRRASAAMRASASVRATARGRRPTSATARACVRRLSSSRLAFPPRPLCLPSALPPSPAFTIFLACTSILPSLSPDPAARSRQAHADRSYLSHLARSLADNQTDLLRENFGDVTYGVCRESADGGFHFRVFPQVGSEADSGAYFTAASEEQSLSQNHMIVPNGCVSLFLLLWTPRAVPFRAPCRRSPSLAVPFQPFPLPRRPSPSLAITRRPWTS